MTLKDKEVLNKVMGEYNWGFPNFVVSQDKFRDNYVNISVFCNAYKSLRTPSGTDEYPERCGNAIFTDHVLKGAVHSINKKMTCAGCIAQYRIVNFWDGRKLDKGVVYYTGVKGRNFALFERYFKRGDIK